MRTRFGLFIAAIGCGIAMLAAAPAEAKTARGLQARLQVPHDPEGRQRRRRRAKHDDQDQARHLQGGRASSATSTTA